MRIDRVKLIAEMARQDIKVKDLARKAHVSRSTITAVRTGKACSENTINHIALGLGVDPADLIKED